jgi:tRNA pseudouridine55 synthase
VNGILNVNKPRGQTSYDIVALMKRRCGEKRVGHAGTLDPLATGVLPLCLGQATRVVEYLSEYTKTYRAEIELGVETDTYDAEGTVLERKDASAITGEQLELALNSFMGKIQQVPPMYSALKLKGKPLYRLARAGSEVERAPRIAEIHGIKLLGYNNPMVTIEVECGKGTYIRSLAHDMGAKLGCGASLKGLVRTRYGPFTIGAAVSLHEIEEAIQFGYFTNLLKPLDVVLSNYPAATVDETTASAIRNGKAVSLDGLEAADGEKCRVYGADGVLIAMMRFEPETGLWRPEKVFNLISGPQ